MQLHQFLIFQVLSRTPPLHQSLAQTSGRFLDKKLGGIPGKPDIPYIENKHAQVYCSAPSQDNETYAMMTSYPPSFLPLISVWHFTSLLRVGNNVTALRVTVLRYVFVGIVGGIKWFLLGGYSWVRRQCLFKPQEIRLDKVLYILNFLLQLCGTFILVQFCNLSYLLGVPPITLHIHNKKVKVWISIRF